MAGIGNIITDYIKRNKAVKKQESRVRQRIREKEELFVADYIKHKYRDIYHEAVQVYQSLLKLHPEKHDLRKTVEHKAWKAMKSVTVHPVFITQGSTTIPVLPQNVETLTSEPSSTEPTTTTTTPEPTTTTPEPTTTTSEPPTPEPTTTPETMYSDNLRLVIPLMKSPNSHPGHNSETLQNVAEETLQEEGGEHLNYDQIDPEIMNQILAELRSDPHLKHLLTDVEYQFEQEMGLDIDMDINMDTGLEDELENWGIW